MEFMGIGKEKGVKLFAELDSEKGCILVQLGLWIEALYPLTP